MKWTKHRVYGRIEYHTDGFIIHEGFGHLPSELVNLSNAKRLKFNSVEEAKKYVDSINKKA